MKDIYFRANNKIVMLPIATFEIFTTQAMQS